METSKKREISQKHQNEVNGLEINYKTELMNLEENFNLKFAEIDNKSKDAENNLNIKHQNEMDILYNSLNDKLPKAVKYSKTYLDLKSQELNLAKQKKYKDALIIKKKCEEIDRLDTDRFNKEKTDKIKSQSIKTANKHLNEKNAMKKRIELEFEELKKDKDRQTQILVLKYKNKKQELENQQKMESILYSDKKKLKASKLDYYLILLLFLIIYFYILGTTTGTIKTKQFIFNNTATNLNHTNTNLDSIQRK